MKLQKYISSTPERYLTAKELDAIVKAIVATHEVTPLHRSRMAEIAARECGELYGFWPRKSLVRLAVKLALYRWEAIKFSTKSVEG
jgi:hypothetical protein